MGNAGTNLKWEYGGAYQNVDMRGIIELQNNSMLKVCDLTVEMPPFMYDADTLFIDPPCNQGNLRSFHTKADKDLAYHFDTFEKCLFERIGEIKPDYLFLEVFKSNRERFEAKCRAMFGSVEVYRSMYYNRPKNICWVLHCTDREENRRYDVLEGMDEEKIIKWLCKNHKYNCIGDLCMGKGLVGRYAHENGKRFVGTELNEKRLAILVDHIKNGTKWTVK